MDRIPNVRFDNKILSSARSHLLSHIDQTFVYGYWYFVESAKLFLSVQIIVVHDEYDATAIQVRNAQIDSRKYNRGLLNREWPRGPGARVAVIVHIKQREIVVRIPKVPYAITLADTTESLGYDYAGVYHLLA